MMPHHAYLAVQQALGYVPTVVARELAPKYQKRNAPEVSVLRRRRV